MYVSANVISIQKFRWNKRVDSMKNSVKMIALNPLTIATILMALCGVGTYHFLSSMDPQYLDSFVTNMSY